LPQNFIYILLALNLLAFHSCTAFKVYLSYEDNAIIIQLKVCEKFISFVSNQN